MMNWITWFVHEYVQRNKVLFVVILVVLLARFCMKKMPKKYAYCLWAIVGIRMLLSFQITSPVSIFRFFPWAEQERTYLANIGETDEKEGYGIAAGYWEEAPDEESPAGTMQAAGSKDPVAGKESWADDKEALAGGKDDVGNSSPLGGEDKEVLEAPEAREPISSDHFPDETEGNAMAATEGSTSQDAAESDAEVRAEPSVSDPEGEASGEDGRFDMESIFFAVWCLGMMTVGGIGIVSYARVRRLVREAVRVEGSLWECDGISTPFVLGVIRPRIYVPFHLEGERRRLVLAHEEQHLRRGDPFVRLFAYALLAVYWMNPLVWLSYSCFIRDQEMSCDESVLERLGAENKKEYGRTLLDLASQERHIGFSPVGFGESDAEKRIRNILDYKKPVLWVFILGILVVTGVGVLCLTTAKNRQNEDSEKSEESLVLQGSEEAGTEKMDPSVMEGMVRTTDLTADVDGDGEEESIQIVDESRQTRLRVQWKDGGTKEVLIQGVELPQTQAETADLDNDGKEEVVLLQSSPLGSTYNWPGKLCIYQVENGEWEEMPDRLIYDDARPGQYQEGYPKTLSDGMFVDVRIEQGVMFTGLRLVRPCHSASAAEAMISITCTYSVERDGWLALETRVYEEYLQDQALLGSQTLFSLRKGTLPVLAESSSKDLSGELYSMLPEEFLFASGAGGWGTTLTIGADGSFSGHYEDGDAGSGEFDWDTRICDFSGRLSTPERRNKLAYLCRVEEMDFPEPDQTYAKGKTLYTTAAPYGLDDVEELVIYLPGYPVSQLPREVVSWIRGSADRYWHYEEPDLLGFYVLYNVKGGQAFTSPTLKDWQGMRMNMKADFAGRTYPAWMAAEKANFDFKAALKLCTDATANFVQKVARKNGQPRWHDGALDFSTFISNERLCKYMDHKVSAFRNTLWADAQWQFFPDLDSVEYLQKGEEQILHLQGSPKYKRGGEEGSCGVIHFLVGLENGRHVIRDWYWDSKDSIDLELRGRYEPEKFLDYWEDPSKYGAILQADGSLTEKAGWKEAYAEYVRRTEFDPETDGYALIYLDGDAIPELYSLTLRHHQKLLTFYNGTLVERTLQRDGFCYLEKTGILFTEGGNNGEFPAEILKLEKGEFTLLGSGFMKTEFIANAESSDPDHLTMFEKYEWNGKSVTEEEYYRTIDAVIRRRDADRPRELYTDEEIIRQLGMP